MSVNSHLSCIVYVVIPNDKRERKTVCWINFSGTSISILGRRDISSEVFNLVSSDSCCYEYNFLAVFVADHINETTFQIFDYIVPLYWRVSQNSWSFTKRFYIGIVFLLCSRPLAYRLIIYQLYPFIFTTWKIQIWISPMETWFLKNDYYVTWNWVSWLF